MADTFAERFDPQDTLDSARKPVPTYRIINGDPYPTTDAKGGLDPAGVDNPDSLYNKSLVSDADRIMGDLRTKTDTAETERQNIAAETVPKLEGLAADRQRLGGELGRVGVPPPPQLYDMPKAPPLEYRSSLQAFANPLTWIAIAGGLMARRPAVGAMTAAAGIMEGWQKGDMQRVELEEKNFKNQTDAVVKQNQKLVQEYDATMKNKHLTLDEKMAEIEAKAASMKDLTTIDQIKKGNVDWPVENAANLAKMNLQLKQQQAHHDEMMARLFGKYGSSSPEERAATVDAIGQYHRAPPTGAALYRKENSDLMEQVYLKYPDYDDRKYWGSKAATVAGTAAEPRALAGSLKQLVEQKNGIEQFENTALKNFESLVQLGAKVDKTGIPAIERWTRAGRQATGDADVAAFNTQWAVTTPEVAKILTNPRLVGQLTDAARHEIEVAMPRAANVGQLQSTLNVLRRDFGNRAVSLDQQIAKVRRQLKGEPEPEPAAPTAPTPETGAPPAGKLKEGTVTNFKNGQSWTLMGGVPVRVH